MLSEAVLLVTLVCLACLTVLSFWGRVRLPGRSTRLVLAGLWVGFTASLVCSAFNYTAPVVPVAQAVDRPIEVPTDEYVGSQACRTCHSYEHRTWFGSYHRTMTQVAAPDTVLASFDNIRLVDGPLTFQVVQRGNRLEVDLPGGYESRPIVMTTGSHHMQAYWFSVHDDARYLGLLPFAYLREEDRWLPRRTMFLRPPEPPESRLAIGQWNEGCIECHATHGRMLPQIREDGNWWTTSVDTQVAELGISCEACHGPGAAHVRANRSPARRYRYHFDDQPDETIVNPSRLSHERSAQVCGQCHAVHAVPQWRRWALEGSDFRPGEDIFATEVRVLVHSDQETMHEEVRRHLAEHPGVFDENFWADGMIRIAGREYNGLLETPCFQRGEMSCLSCHQMHAAADDPRPLGEWANDQLQPGMEGNRACLQCHPDFEDQQRLTEHTHHASISSGSLCYNCHMSYTTYGLLKAIRSHQVDTPSVATSVETGRPNACNQCHLDKSLGWTADWLSRWYDFEQPVLSEDQQTIAASVLWLLSGDAAQRALMAWSYGWQDAREASGHDWMPPYLLQLLEDPYDAVQFIAARALRESDRFADFEYLWPASDDERKEQIQRGWNIWKELPGRPTRPAVLIDESGGIMQDVFQRLLRARNDRPVYVAE